MPSYDVRVRIDGVSAGQGSDIDVTRWDTSRVTVRHSDDLALRAQTLVPCVRLCSGHRAPPHDDPVQQVQR